MYRSVILWLTLILVYSQNISFSQISTIWSKYYNKDIRDEACFVSLTFDSGCIITGTTDGYERTYDLFILKLDSNADTLWSQTIGEKQTQERGLCIRQTIDSCYIVTGFIEINYEYKIYLLKLNADGDTLWSRTYGNGVGGSVIQTHDRNYLIAADKDTLTERFTHLIKTDSDGNVLWSRTYDIKEPITFSTIETSKGDLIIGCSGFSLSENKYVAMYCTDSLGNMKWQLFNEKYALISGVVELPGNFIVGVGSLSGDQESRLGIIKVDSSGIILSEKEYGQGEDTYCCGSGIELSNANRFIISANCKGYGDVISNQWVWLLVTDLNGDTLCTQIINNTYSDTQSGQLNSITKYSDNQYYGAGWFHKQPDYNWDFWITKFSLDTITNGIDFVGQLEKPEYLSLNQNYPNPFNSSTIISFTIPSNSYVSLRIYDMLGKEVTTLVSDELTAGKYSRLWIPGNLASGIYFYQLQANSFIETRKILLIK
jgi:hypothetical protein